MCFFGDPAGHGESQPFSARPGTFISPALAPTQPAWADAEQHNLASGQQGPWSPWGSERVIHVRTWGRVVPHMCVFACVFACVPVERNLYVQMEEGVIADCERRV